VVNGMIAEFLPLATSRSQRLQLDVADNLHWQAPREIVEAVLGNLLLNAIQHGGEGTITLAVDMHAMVLRNPSAPAHGSDSGFGFGLQIVERLCVRCGWQLRRSEADGMVEHGVIAAAGACEPAA